MHLDIRRNLKRSGYKTLSVTIILRLNRTIEAVFAYFRSSLAAVLEQLFQLFGLTFVLAWLLYHVSMEMRKLGSTRLGLGYFYVVAPGVACHETGHALGCLLTGKRISKFVPFRPQVEDDGVTLGYVEHESSHSILGRAGEFVVATGPVWFGGLVTLALVRMLVGPTPFESLSGAEAAPMAFLPYLGSVAAAASSLASRAFEVWHWHGPLDAVLIYLLICVASEITLSGPDMQGMLVGLVAICTLVIVGNFIPFFDAMLESAMIWLRPWLFLLHTTLAFALLLDVCFYGLYRALDAAYPPQKKSAKGNEK